MPDLSQSAFDKFLTYLDPDRDHADERYEQLRRSLIGFLERNGSLTPEDDADEVIYRVCRKIDEGVQIGNIFNFCHGVMKHVVQESWKKQKAKLVQERDDILSQIAAAEPEEDSAQMVCLEKCLSELSAEARDLIVSYYEGEGSAKIENRKRLAAELDIPTGTLQMRALRIREWLYNCINDCLKQC